MLTDKNEHLRGTPEYVPKWNARLVDCGNFEHIGHEEDIRADSLRLKAADITNAYFQGKPLERLLILKVPKHPKGVQIPKFSRPAT